MKLQGFKFAMATMCLVFVGCSSDKGGGGSGGGGGDGSEEVETDAGDISGEENSGSALSPLDWSKVDFAFVSPKDSQDLAPGKVKVEVSTNLGAQGTWSLFYTRSFKSIDNAKPIKESLEPDETSVEWDTTKIEPGTYFLFASLHFGSQVNVRFFQGAITIETADSDNRTPFVSVTTNFRQQIIDPAAETFTVNYIAIDPEGEGVAYRLMISEDDGDTWSNTGVDLTPGGPNVVESEEDPGNFTLNWPVVDGSFEEGAQYRVRLEYEDKSGKVGEGPSEVFGFGDPNISYFSAVRDVLDDNCMTSCHTDAWATTDGNENLSFEYYDGFGNINGPANRRGNGNNDIYNRIMRASDEAGQMPQGGSLDQLAKDRLTMWFWRNGSAGSSDIRFRDIGGNTFDEGTAVNLELGTPTSITFRIDDNDAADRTAIETNPADHFEVFISQPNEEPPVSVEITDFTGATFDPVAGDNSRIDVTLPFTPAGLTVGADTSIQVRVTDGNYRRARDTRSGVTVSPDPG
jgi:hypothetical protein